MKESSAVLSVRGLTKVLGGRRVVDTVNFDLRTGEVFGLLGPNGAGKSTTIKLLVGLMRPNDGDVVYHGKAFREHSDEIKAKIGCIVESPDLYGYMTGRQNLQFFASLYDDIPTERQLHCAELTGIDRALDKRVDHYSMGMKQRLALAVALLHRPEILILDEPTNGLDPAGIHDTRMLLRDLASREGLAIMVSSHILSEMQLMCDRVAIMNQGKIITVQTVRELMEATEGHLANFELEVDRTGDALALLREAGYQVRAEGHLLKVTAPDPDSDSRDLLRLLLDHDLRLIRFFPGGQQTLEEAFIKLTQGGEIR